MKHSLEKLEERIFFDISAARRSYEIVVSFLKPLYEKSTNHFRNKDHPLTNSIVAACAESLVASLGRLYQDAPDSEEATLLKYVSAVKQEIRSKGPRFNTSGYAKDRKSVV